METCTCGAQVRKTNQEFAYPLVAEPMLLRGRGPTKRAFAWSKCPSTWTLVNSFGLGGSSFNSRPSAYVQNQPNQDEHVMIQTNDTDHVNVHDQSALVHEPR